MARPVIVRPAPSPELGGRRSLPARKTNNTVYYYVTNLQGDVIQLVDNTGTAVAAYEYDPFGNIVSQSGDLADLNPLRYRGYYYDTETGFYYLQSRYYDPAIARFINADSYASTGQGIIGCNMLAYCLNDPVSYFDGAGMRAKSAILETAIDCPASRSAIFFTEEERQYYATVKKYNSGTINFQENSIGTDSTKLNVTFYPDQGLIHIENSHAIRSKLDKIVIIEAIMQSEYYDPTKYGNSVETMLIEWSGHNFIYRISSCDLVLSILQWRGYEDPVKSTRSVDFRKNLEPSAKRNYELVTLWGLLQW